ncbi:uncharacterized protein C8Q71DRAFT_860186 [Rhodofomes roseus]|uniref:Uncharacterized protein n=1 Tax=Rhodofomes roseus TaxID=34475 RepID=A0A4Y9XVF8_9APHY|nr:uncharacterized protein C8Q71DRAFT_860186 [Rhodofomes roseus]KAH9833389.1 hypothetical protein C8Q71DRAFT_860186 [Rhodofomes roseus]TFY54126.1 hypothetical protein EVJ58_g9038 [Rhodofomes roseus]
MHARTILSVISAAIAAMPAFSAPLGVNVDGLFNRSFVEAERREHRKRQY